MSKGPGIIQKKLLILLLGGISLTFASFSPRRHFRTLKAIGRELEKIDREQLRESINLLYRSKLIGYRENPDGSVSIILNDEGRGKALTYKLDEMKITIPNRWDQKWRIVIFDIPHRLKNARDALRAHLKRLGFHQLQKSVFIFPYECRQELEFIIELYDLRPFVRQITATHLDNELHLKRHFDLI